MKFRFTLAIAAILIVLGSANLNSPVYAQNKLRVALSAPISPLTVHNTYGPIHYGEAFGLKMTAEDFINFNSGPTATQAVLSGQAEVLTSSITSLFALREAGQNFKAFCPVVGTADYVLVGRNGIKTLEQVLDPKTRVASDGPASAATGILNAMFQNHNLKAKVSDLPNLRVLATPDLRQAAWVANEVDVTLLRLGQFRQVAKDVPDGVIIATLYEEVPVYLFSVSSAPAAWLDKNLDTAAAYCASMLQGAQEISANFDLYVAAVKENIAKPPAPEALKESFGLISKYDFWQVKSGITPEAVNFMSNLALKGGVINQLPDAKDVLDTRPYEMALKMLPKPKATGTAEAQGTMAATP